MWASPQEKWFDLRHEASRFQDLKMFGWHHHDLRSFGEQTIMDGPLNITTAFLKLPSTGYGGDWLLRMDVKKDIKGEEPPVAPAPGVPGHLQHVYMYLGQEHLLAASQDNPDNQSQVARFQPSLGLGLAVRSHPGVHPWNQQGQR
jgi:hypothetical protein